MKIYIYIYPFTSIENFRGKYRLYQTVVLVQFKHKAFRVTCGEKADFLSVNSLDRLLFIPMYPLNKQCIPPIKAGGKAWRANTVCLFLLAVARILSSVTV